MARTTLNGGVAAPGGSPEQGHRLWGARFSGSPAAALDALNRSIDVDFRLWPHDVRLSKAWTLGLWNAGVLSLDESREMERGLDAVAARLHAGEQPRASDEDVHTLIDRLLHEEIGDLASKLHTGRSRNDQVATASRLWTIEACGRLDVAMRGLQEVVLRQAETVGDAMMPAYTHMQRAQPVLAAHWLMSHFWPLERDRSRLDAVARSASVLPLGSGAVAGSAFPVSRILLKESLGFASISANSMDAVADRDFVAEMLFVCALTGTHLSRLAEDFIFYGSGEFGFVRFGDRFTTGSSMMPQKRNPDALELTRGSGARVLGDLTALLATLKGLPSGYNKDLQEDKRFLFDAVDTLLAVLPAAAGALAESTFDVDRMRGAVSSAMMATDLADWLVEHGATFREAHGIVGRLVRQAEELGVELSTLPQSAFARQSPLLDESSRESLLPQWSLSRREIPGGTGVKAVRDQIAAAREALRPRRDTPRGNEVVIRPA